MNPTPHRNATRAARRARSPSPAPIACPTRTARRRRNPHRPHEGECRQLDGDLVRRHLCRAEPPHQQADRSECPHLEHLLESDRRADREHARKRAEAERVGPEHRQVRPQGRPGQCQQRAEHPPSAHHGGDRATLHAQCRRPQVSVDEHPVERHVEHIRGENGGHDRRQPAHRLQALAQHDEHQERQDARDRDVHVRRRVGNDLRWLPGPADHPRGRCHEQCARHGQAQAQHEPPLDAPFHRPFVVCPHGLGNDGIEREQRPHREHDHVEEIDIPQRHGRQRARRDVPDHDRVDYPHPHHSHLHQDDRDGERGQRAEFEVERVARVLCPDGRRGGHWANLARLPSRCHAYTCEDCARRAPAALTNPSVAYFFTGHLFPVGPPA